jgi:hypothetical protein
VCAAPLSTHQSPLAFLPPQNEWWCYSSVFFSLSLPWSFPTSVTYSILSRHSRFIVTSSFSLQSFLLTCNNFQLPTYLSLSPLLPGVRVVHTYTQSELETTPSFHNIAKCFQNLIHQAIDSLHSSAHLSKK